MADRIDRKDTERVFALLEAEGVVLEDRVSPRERRTDDGWKILIAGWDHAGLGRGWSRGYTIAAVVGRGYVGPEDRRERYHGLGWHARMAEDLLSDLCRLRAERA